MMDPRNTETERYKERIDKARMQRKQQMQERVAVTTKQPQWVKVLQYMRNHEHITSAIAFTALGITSLHRRLTDIERNTSYVIDRKRVDVPGRTHHFEYRLL